MDDRLIKLGMSSDFSGFRETENENDKKCNTGKGNAELDVLFSIDRAGVKQQLTELWLDESIMEPSLRDDYIHIEALVGRFGREFIEDKYINERTVCKALKNMRELYAKIKRE